MAKGNKKYRCYFLITYANVKKIYFSDNLLFYMKFIDFNELLCRSSRNLFSEICYVVQDIFSVFHYLSKYPLIFFRVFTSPEHYECQPISAQHFHNLETSQIICKTSQLIGFRIVAKLIIPNKHTTCLTWITRGVLVG